MVTAVWGHAGPALGRCDVRPRALQGDDALETEKDPFSSSQVSGDLGMSFFLFRGRFSELLRHSE